MGLDPSPPPLPARTPDWETPCRVELFWENQHAPIQKSQVDLSQWGNPMEKLPNPLSSTQIWPKIGLSLLTQNEVKCCSPTLKSTSSQKERFLDQKSPWGQTYVWVAVCGGWRAVASGLRPLRRRAPGFRVIPMATWLTHV